ALMVRPVILVVPALLAIILALSLLMATAPPAITAEPLLEMILTLPLTVLLKSAPASTAVAEPETYTLQGAFIVTLVLLLIPTAVDGTLLPVSVTADSLAGTAAAIVTSLASITARLPVRLAEEISAPLSVTAVPTIADPPSASIFALIISIAAPPL